MKMAHKRVFNVIKKEWEVTFKSVNNTLLVTLLPLIIVGQVLVLILPRDLWVRTH